MNQWMNLYQNEEWKTFSHEKCKGKEYYPKTPYLRRVLFEKGNEMFLKVFSKISNISWNGRDI